MADRGTAEISLGGPEPERLAPGGTGAFLAGIANVAWKNPGGAISLVFLVSLAVTAWPAFSLVAPHGPFEIFRTRTLEGPSGQFLLGTDELGRDILSRVLYGTRVSYSVGFGSVFLAAIVGVPVGLWSGYVLGIVDAISMRIADALMAFPSIVLAMVLVGFLGPSPTNVAVALAFVNLPRFARIARGEMLSLKSRPYVDAALAAGATNIAVVVRTIAPNAMAPIVVQVAVAIAEAILLEAGLSFLGLGVQPPNPSWGLMLGTARGFLSHTVWYGLTPGIVLVLVILALNALADSMQKLMDPQRRRL